MTSSPNVNPFYIEPKQQEDEVDEWAWEDDTDDLEELLGDGAEGQYPQPRSGDRPVQNRASAPSGDRIRYMAVALVITIVLISVMASTSKSDNIPTNGSLSHHDSLANERPRIVVLGERHSGLQWLEHSLRLCFPNATVSSTLSRVGYFFQDDPLDPDIHVVAVALNPYDWVELMRTHPQYMPNHANIDDWKEFLTREWTMQRPERDNEMESKHGKVCQMDFGFDEVVSCVESLEDDPTTNPIYELKRDGSGEPFESILELRAAKFHNHVEQMSQWVRSVNVVQYETLLDKVTDHSGKTVPGIFDLIEKLAADLDLEWSCSIRYAEPVRITSTHTADFVTYLNKHVHWDAEALFGYTPIDESAIPDNVSGSKENEPTGDDDHPETGGNQKTINSNGNTPGGDKQISVGDDDVTETTGKNSEDDHVGNDDAAVESSSDTTAPTTEPAESEKQSGPSAKPPGISRIVSAAPSPDSPDFMGPSDAQVSAAPSAPKLIAGSTSPSIPTISPKNVMLPTKWSPEPTITKKGMNDNENATAVADDDKHDVDDSESDTENKVVHNGHEVDNNADDDDDTSSSKVDENEDGNDDGNDDDDSNDDNGAGNENRDEDPDGEESIDENDDGNGANTAMPSPARKSASQPSRGKDRPSPRPSVHVLENPSSRPTVHLTRKPSPHPTIQLTYKPSPHPSVQATFEPTLLSTPNPTSLPSAADTYSPTALQENSASSDKPSIEGANSENGDKVTPDVSDNEANDEGDGAGKSYNSDESTKKGNHKHSSDETEVHVDDTGENDDNGEQKKKHKDKKGESVGNQGEKKKKTKHKKHKEKSVDEDSSSKKTIVVHGSQ
jgi:hypothetical protein